MPSAVSTISPMLPATKAWAMAAAQKRAPLSPSPSWATLAAIADISAARFGLPGFTQPQLSIKICPPICSATVVPFWAIEPDRGAGTPARRFRYAVCSVETPKPPHQYMPCSSAA